MHQVKLSFSKMTTWHGNNMHSAITKEPQFDTRPSGPILVSSLMQEKEQNKNNVAAIDGGRHLEVSRA